MTPAQPVSSIARFASSADFTSPFTSTGTETTSRARAAHAQSAAPEWPIFAVFAVVFWAKTIRDEFRIRRGEMPDPRLVAAEAERLPAGVTGSIQVSSVQAGGSPDEDEDEELSAYNAYLARLNAEVKDHGRWHGLR